MAALDTLLVMLGCNKACIAVGRDVPGKCFTKVVSDSHSQKPNFVHLMMRYHGIFRDMIGMYITCKVWSVECKVWSVVCVSECVCVSVCVCGVWTAKSGV